MFSNCWEIGKVRANFLRHEGYLGAIGAFLQGCEAEVAETGDERSELNSGKQTKGRFNKHNTKWIMAHLDKCVCAT